MFLDVDKAEATNAIKQSQKTCLGLGPQDSASLKGYTGLNNKQYARLKRMLFYLTGLWLLAAIKSVRRLKVTQIKGNYKTLTRRVHSWYDPRHRERWHRNRKKNTCRLSDCASIWDHKECFSLAPWEGQASSFKQAIPTPMQYSFYVTQKMPCFGSYLRIKGADHLSC